MMHKNEIHKAEPYRIRVKETLGCQFGDWMDDLALIPQENGETVLVGAFHDQPALRGFLDQLWNLNITVISVERINNES